MKNNKPELTAVTPESKTEASILRASSSTLRLAVSQLQQMSKKLDNQVDLMDTRWFYRELTTTELAHLSLSMYDLRLETAEHLQTVRDLFAGLEKAPRKAKAEQIPKATYEKPWDDQHRELDEALYNAQRKDKETDSEDKRCTD